MAKQGEHGISWTDQTWNVLRGCSRTSEGCRFCYAEHTAARFSFKGGPYEGLAQIKNIQRKDGSTLTTEARWTGEVRFIEDKLYEPLRWKQPRMVFVNSMSDLFHEKVPDEWIDKIFAVMALAPKHTFQSLTKRAERMRDYCNDPDTRRRVALAMLDIMKDGWCNTDGMIVPLEPRPDSTEESPLFWSAWPLENVWFGVSVENQKTANERVPLLLETPAVVRWVSYEPALGPVDFDEIVMPDGDHLADMRWYDHDVDAFATLDWIVCGGESGPRARPMHPDWAIDVYKQCRAAGVKFFMKQLGGWPNKCADLSDFPMSLRVREYPNV